MRRAAALPLSFLAHGVALTAVVVLSVMRADLPAARAASAPIDPPVWRAPVVTVTPPAPPREPRPAPSAAPRETAPVTPAQPPPAPVDALPAPSTGGPAPADTLVDGPLGNEPGPFCVGCVGPRVPTDEPQDPQGTGTQASGPVRIGGDIREPRKLRHVVPVYPEMARAVGVRGTVTVECIVTPEGRVADVRVVSGHPLLAPAAARAVEQWLFTPTLLNGVAVPVILTVTVKFDLR